MKTLQITLPTSLRLGQAVYNAVYKHLKDKGKPHTDRDVMNEMFQMSDRLLFTLLKGEGA